MLKFIVSHYIAESEQDDYLNGIVPGVCSEWTERDLPVPGRFSTVEEALQAVCKANCFDWRRESWFMDECDDEPRFIGDFMVDVNNAEASEYEIGEWRKGRRNLWNCRITVHLMKQEHPLPLDAGDVKGWA